MTVEGTPPSEADPVQGNTVVAETAQASQDVWVATASDAAKWTFFDRTLTEGGETNGNGATNGLFAQGLQTPGRLYLDLTDEASKEVYQKSQAFSAQKWYRYGYPGAGTATPSGMEPKEASENDFALAIAFQVRLPEDATVATLNMDKVPTAKVQTFFVEPAAAPVDGAVAPTLSLKSNGTTQLAIQKSVIVRTPLDVSNVSESTRNPDSLALARGVEIHRGDAMEGKYYGAYISGNQTFDWPLGVSSVPRLEVAPGGLVTLLGPQDLRTYQTVLAVGEGATLRQADAGNTLRAAGMELGEGATFAFNSTATDGGEGAAVMGVQLDGNLTLTGDATLASEAAGGKTVFSAAAFRGPVPVEGETWAAGAALTLDATTDATTWRIPTVDWANLGLTKTGPGTVTFSGGVSTPPTVAGMVSVKEGKLCVAPAAATAEDSSESATHSGPGIGHRGLHVAAGATLAKTDETASESAEHVLACIPNEQTLSGAGMIDGFVRLCEGATFDASECVTKNRPLTVTKGIAVAGNAGANITVALPEGYKAPQPFFEVRRSESHARRRLKSMKGADQWDTVAKIEGGTTLYYAQPAGIPRPEDPTDGSTDYDVAFATQMIRYYRGDNAAYLGAAYALTQAGNYRLNEEEIGNAFRCFEGVWTFDHEKAEGAGQAEGVTYVDAQNFYMAYEFGISRVTVAPVPKLSKTDDDLYVIAEVKVEQKVTEQWPNLARGLTRTAAFAPGVAFELYGHRPGAAVTTAEGSTSMPPHKDFTDYVKFDGVVELSAFDGVPLAAEQTRSGGTSWFAIPYTEENFPQRTTTSLKVKVIPPATSQEEVAARLLRARDAR